MEATRDGPVNLRDLKRPFLMMPSMILNKYQKTPKLRIPHVKYILPTIIEAVDLLRGVIQNYCPKENVPLDVNGKTYVIYAALRCCLATSVKIPIVEDMMSQPVKNIVIPDSLLPPMENVKLKTFVTFLWTHHKDDPFTPICNIVASSKEQETKYRIQNNLPITKDDVNLSEMFEIMTNFWKLAEIPYLLLRIVWKAMAAIVATIAYAKEIGQAKDDGYWKALEKGTNNLKNSLDSFGVPENRVEIVRRSVKILDSLLGKLEKYGPINTEIKPVEKLLRDYHGECAQKGNDANAERAKQAIDNVAMHAQKKVDYNLCPEFDDDDDEYDEAMSEISERVSGLIDAVTENDSEKEEGNETFKDALSFVDEKQIIPPGAPDDKGGGQIEAGKEGIPQLSASARRLPLTPDEQLLLSSDEDFRKSIVDQYNAMVKCSHISERDLTYYKTGLLESIRQCIKDLNNRLARKQALVDNIAKELE
jgi:hypothetical protein